jgi:TorA maturation chaperone TorD
MTHAGRELAWYGSLYRDSQKVVEGDEGERQSPMDDEMTQPEMLEILQGRASSYSFLSAAYRQEVTTEFLQALVTELAGGVSKEAESEGYRLLAGYALKIHKADLEKARVDLGAEYIALMLGASARAISPYESVYTSPEHLIMQEARDEVLAEYLQEGLTRTDEFRLPEDHIAIELEFMSYLCQQAADAVEAEDIDTAVASLQKQRRFLRKHLLRWIPRFCDDLAGATTSDFYRGVAKITVEHLGLEAETIDALVGALQGDVREIQPSPLAV